MEGLGGASSALQGIKVADFSHLTAGPLSMAFLADHGAEVVRVESNLAVDGQRTSPPFRDDIPGINRTANFAWVNRNKYGVTLNLKHPQGKALAHRLVAWADVVADSFKPGTMARLGLGYEELASVNPGLVMVSTSGQGQTGPHASQPMTGIQLTALAGLDHLTGFPHGEPIGIYGAYTDLTTPRFIVALVLAALDYRRRTGKGQYLDVSQYECGGVHMVAPFILDYTANGRDSGRRGNRHPAAAPHGVYPCRGQDQWCTLAVFTDAEWQALCRVAGATLWADDARFATLAGRKRYEEDLDACIGAWTSSYLPEEFMRVLQAAGVAAGRVETCRDLFEDPQLQYRHAFWTLDHPEIGPHANQTAAFQLSKTPAMPRMPSPLQGQHNEYVYTQLLGLSDEEFVSLIASGALD